MYHFFDGMLRLTQLGLAIGILLAPGFFRVSRAAVLSVASAPYVEAATLLGAKPGWLVRAVLPQVTLLRHSALAVTHGGNNSVTEALTAGVPLLVLPLSTDQFAGAAALERAGVGEVFDPNTTGPDELRAAAARLLALPSEPAGRLAALAHGLTSVPGPQRAREALLAQGS